MKEDPMSRLHGFFPTADPQPFAEGYATESIVVLTFPYNLCGNRVATLEDIAPDFVIDDGEHVLVSTIEEDLAGGYYWSGQEHDVEADLQYGRTRCFDPAIGRWLSEDPLGFENGGDHLYPYPSPTADAPDSKAIPPEI
jgi:RHS repeat-associated protein